MAVKKCKLFSPWELETIFHVFSNESAKPNSKFGKKYQKILSKAINERGRCSPNYHSNPKLWN
jgi:hypothetical protein